jgi:hypothetical protein
MTRRLASIVAAALFTTPAVRADVESGPQAGEQVPALKVWGVIGSIEGKEADYSAERKEAPTIYLFVKAEDGGIPVGGRPAARFMKVLDEQADKPEGTAIVAVWLGDKAFDKHKEYLPRINMSLKFERTSLAAFDGDRSGPKGWSVNPDAHLTVVVVHKGRVVKSFAFESVNETDVKPVLDELKKAVEKK